MRRLHPPTLAQWGCPHRWKEQSSKPQGDKLHRLRYYFCQACGLRVKTREAPEVPWDEGDFVAAVQTLLPEGQPVSLRDHGITELPLDGLNACLKPMGYRIHASERGDAARAMACVDRKGRVSHILTSNCSGSPEKGDEGGSASSFFAKPSNVIIGKTNPEHIHWRDA